jgi:hypothetical protein
MEFAAFVDNCRFLSPPMDPLFVAIMKLRVWIGDMDELSFKLETLTKLRSSTFYKRLKPALVEEIEKGMGLGALTPLSFWAMCEVHGVGLRVVASNYYYDCGVPKMMWRRGKLLRLGDTTALFELKPLKPLYAISYYSLAELDDMACKLGTCRGKKTVMYEAIKEKIITLH